MDDKPKMTALTKQEVRNLKRVSYVLKNFSDSSLSTHFTIGELKTALADRVFGILMVALTLPNLIPIPIPGISAFFGMPLLFLTLQMVMGYKAPWFPKWLEKKSFSLKDFNTVLTYALPHLIKLEKLLKPRLGWLMSPFSERVLAGICFIMAIIITLPIPLGNWLPAFSIFLIALAILEHDGLVAIVGVVVSVLSLIWLSSLMAAFLMATLAVVNKFFQ